MAGQWCVADDGGGGGGRKVGEEEVADVQHVVCASRWELDVVSHADVVPAGGDGIASGVFIMTEEDVVIAGGDVISGCIPDADVVFAGGV